MAAGRSPYRAIGCELTAQGPRPTLRTLHVTDFLATAIFGPDRASYWQAKLLAADQPDPAAPAAARIAELEREVADLQARLRRQVLALEDDGVAAAARRQIAARIGELEHDLGEREASLSRLRQEYVPTPPAAAVVELLTALPSCGEDLRTVPQAELRPLLDSLDLRVTYHHREHLVDVELTLAGDGDADSQDWLVGLAGLEPAT
jgi:hypothetical protein